MTEIITLPRSVLEQALEALESGIQYEYHGNPYSDNDAARCVAYDALRAALDQPQDHHEQHLNMVPAGWKLVPVEPTDEMAEAGDHEIEKWGVDASSSGAFRAMLAAAPQPPVVEQPQSVTDCHQSQPKGEPVGLLPLDCRGGYANLQPQVEQEPVAWQSIEAMAAQRYKVVPSHDSMFYRHAVVAGDGTQQLYIGRETECENMTRKFAGAFLDGAYVASLYTHPQPPRQPLTDEQVREIGKSYQEAFDDSGWSFEFARAIERAHGIGGEA